jgi:hypothetical protein
MTVLREKMKLAQAKGISLDQLLMEDQALMRRRTQR